MPKSPADPGKTPVLPPCNFTSSVQFSVGGVLIVGDHNWPGGPTLPPPPGGAYPPLLYIGSNQWQSVVTSGTRSWTATLHISCPNNNGSGILTLIFSDPTGNYLGDYTCSPTVNGQGTYSGPEPGVLPLTQSVSQT